MCSTSSARMSHVKWVHNFCVLPFFFRLCQSRVSSLYECCTDYPWHATPLSCFICIVLGVLWFLQFCSVFFFLLFFSFHPLISLLNFFALFCGCSWSTSSRLSLGLVVYLPCGYRLVSISGWSDWAYFVIFMLSCSSAAAPVCQSSQKGARRSPGRGPAWLWSLDGTRSFVHSPFFPRN